MGAVTRDATVKGCIEAEAFRELARANPGCGSCAHGEECPWDEGVAWCRLDDGFARTYDPQCSYEDWTER